MLTTLFLLGLALGLDSFRVSVGLGPLGLSSVRQLQIALIFGLCEGFAPLVGLAVGRSLVEAICRWTEYLGPLVIGGYGLYVVYLARFSRGEGQVMDDRWMLFGLPLALSLDNLVAGIGLGVLGYPIFFAALTIGAISGLMALAGLKLGNAMGRYLPVGSDVLGGVALVFVAVTFVLDAG
jgi:manganese efflux pump family protein